MENDAVKKTKAIGQKVLQTIKNEITKELQDVAVDQNGQCGNR